MLVDYSCLSGTHDPELVRDLAVHIVNNATVGRASKADRRVYILRKAAGTRHIANEDELSPIMAEYGVEMVDMAELDFVEQVRLLSRCHLLISPHGAGLTNAIFMPPESTVIEVTSADKLAEPGLRYCFYSLLSSLNYSYTPLLAESLDARDPNANMTVSPDSLATVLSAIYA